MKVNTDHTTRYPRILTTKDSESFFSHSTQHQAIKPSFSLKKTEDTLKRVSVKINYRGRLGNNLLQYIAAQILAKKYNLSIDAPTKRSVPNEGVWETSTSSEKKITYDWFSLLNEHKTNKRTQKFKEFEEVNDINFLEFLNSEKTTLTHGLTMNGFFQHPFFLINFKKEILDHFLTNEIKQHNEDLVVVMRAGADTIDKNGKNRFGTLSFFENALSNYSFRQGYISSDNINHPDVQLLIRKFNLKTIKATPVEKIKICSSFKKIIISDGSFCFWIAYLSSSAQITHPENLKMFAPRPLHKEEDRINMYKKLFSSTK